MRFHDRDGLHLPGLQEGLKIRDAITHPDSKNKRAKRANDRCCHQGPRNNLPGLLNLFREVEACINTGKNQTGSDQAGQKRHTGRPSRCVLKIGPHSRGRLFLSESEACYRYDKERRKVQDDCVLHRQLILFSGRQPSQIPGVEWEAFC